DFVSIGNFLHPPNWDQVLYLKTEIWPLIRKELPTANVEIYGAYPSAKVKQLHNKKQGFLVKGRAENAEECIAEKRILLAPLRFGAGLKGKLIDAMLVGTPSITTTIGAEGMCGDLPWAGEIANTAEEFAKQAVLKYANEKRWMTAQKNGFKILKNRFLADRFKDAFLQEVEFITDNLTQHRNQNFIGQILQQQSLNSSKYMSLWIEAKNN
ncbi:MAG: glycosyltransferase family 4 protein, partial [Bacteroidota bacterium]